MKKKEYDHSSEESKHVVAEPAAAYGYMETPAISIGRTIEKESFEDGWSRSLTIEEFRTLCRTELKRMYAAH